jgi:hypothetical protein
MARARLESTETRRAGGDTSERRPEHWPFDFDLGRTAFHEAGHAAAGMALGRRLGMTLGRRRGYVSIYKGGGGGCAFGGEPEEVVPPPGCLLVTSVAGPVAEHLAGFWLLGCELPPDTPRPLSPGVIEYRRGYGQEYKWGDDGMRAAWEAAQLILWNRRRNSRRRPPPVSDAEVVRAVRAAEWDADLILRANWEWVDRMARALCDRRRRTLTGPQVQRLAGTPALPEEARWGHLALLPFHAATTGTHYR